MLAKFAFRMRSIMFLVLTRRDSIKARLTSSDTYAMRVEGGYNQSCLQTVTPNISIPIKDLFLIYRIFFLFLLRELSM
jgi:hypothetical protein